MSGCPTNTDIIIFLGYSKVINGFDNLGLGGGTGRSSTGTGWQTVFESFYRWQVTRELLITPDIQLILGDDSSGERKLDLSVVLELESFFKLPIDRKDEVIDRSASIEFYLNH